MKLRDFKTIFNVIVGTFICSLALEIFLIPHNILHGGASGISIILNNYFPIKHISIYIFLVSIFLLLISFIFLGKEKTKYSLNGTVLFPLFCFFIELLLKKYPIYIESTLLSSVYGAIAFGFGLGLVYKENRTTGGSVILSQILNKYTHISMDYCMYFIDGIILLIGAFTFNTEILLYSILVLYIRVLITDKIEYGISNKKSFYIITNYPEEVEKYINNNLHHGCTILNGTGSYKHKNKKVILTVIPTSDYYKLKSELKEIDKDVFFVVSDSYETEGGA